MTVPASDGSTQGGNADLPLWIENLRRCPEATTLLALDCSTARGGVALARWLKEENFHIFGRRNFVAGRGHGGEMFTVLQAALEEIKEAGGRLGGILVGLGPGSYSGVRQAIAAATGIAAASGAWLRGVPSVIGLRAPGRNVHVIGDARRGTFYYTAVREDGVCLVGPELLANTAELSARLDAHPKWGLVVMESPLPGGLLPDARITMPEAGQLFCTPLSTHQHPPLEPIYLRPVNITLPGTVKTREP